MVSILFISLNRFIIKIYIMINLMIRIKYHKHYYFCVYLVKTKLFDSFNYFGTKRVYVIMLINDQSRPNENGATITWQLSLIKQLLTLQHRQLLQKTQAQNKENFERDFKSCQEGGITSPISFRRLQKITIWHTALRQASF